MNNIQTTALFLLTGAMFLAAPDAARADRASRDFRRIDIDDDGRLSRAEWLRRGNFDKLDTNKSGYLSPAEMRRNYRGALDGRPGAEQKERRRGERKKDRKKGKKRDRRKRREEASTRPAAIRPANDPAYVEYSTLDEDTLCGIGRGRECSPKAPIKRGLLATGLGPEFPDNADCHGIDDYFAMDYSFKRGREAYHGGMDLPTAWGTPMLAIADGTVVGKYKGENSARGIELVLRHSPQDTGLAIWVYSLYSHFDKLPKQAVGQRVRMGETLGPTGNSGIDPKTKRPSTRRRPAIHFAVFYSTRDTYTELNDGIIPVDGYWMDPNALYRKKPPFDSVSMKALPEAEKGVPVSIMFTDGETVPANTKLVWPYACRRQ